MDALETVKTLSWRSMPSKIGDLGKAILPPDMTIAEVLTILNQQITLDGQPYRLGSPQL
jgi:hypothetical protein